jgi:hypothetical protein
MRLPSTRRVFSRSDQGAKARPRRRQLRPTLQLLEDGVGPANFTVVSTAAGGMGSLRYSIEQLNADAERVAQTVK